MGRLLWTTLCVVVGVLALVALAVYVAVGETGPVGWINAAQMSIAGSYSRKITMLVLICVVGIPAIVVGSMVFSGSKPAAVPHKPVSVPAIALVGWVVCMLLVWAGAWGWNAWQAQTANVDANATYVPIELAAGTSGAATGHDHLALSGRVLGDHTVERKGESDGSGRVILVPIVERGWHEGDPVHFVVSLDKYNENALRGALRSAADNILVRADGSPPTPSRQVFTRMGAPLADDVRLLALVPSQNGKPAAGPTEPDWNSIVIWGGVGSAIATLFFAFFAAAPWLSARQGKQDAAKALKRARR